jgi:RNA polymerase sigma factor (sigma-70 family)
MDTVLTQPVALRQNVDIEETVRSERGRLLNFIRTRVPSEDDAQDILQDVLGQLVEAYRRVDAIERVGAWLFRVARNKITDAYRRRRPEAQFGLAREGDDGTMPGLEDEIATSTENPEALYIRETLWSAVEAALAELPQAQRDAFVSHELEGLSFREMAERTGDSENALRLRKHYATRSLRTQLAHLYREL